LSRWKLLGVIGAFGVRKAVVLGKPKSWKILGRKPS